VKVTFKSPAVTDTFTATIVSPTVMSAMCWDVIVAVSLFVVVELKASANLGLIASWTIPLTSL